MQAIYTYSGGTVLLKIVPQHEEISSCPYHLVTSDDYHICDLNAQEFPDSFTFGKVKYELEKIV